MENAQETIDGGLPTLIIAIDELVAAAASNDEQRLAAANAAVMAFLENPPTETEPSITGYYTALANALLFVNEIEIAELRRAELPLPMLLVSVRKRWSHNRCGFSYSCVAGRATV
jgi:hypothetical protein